MSMDFCHECSREYDTDYFTECPHCENDLFECDRCQEMKPDCETVWTAIGDYTRCEDCSNVEPF